MLSDERRFRCGRGYLESRSMRAGRARACTAIVEPGGWRIHISGFMDWRQAANTDSNSPPRTSVGCRGQSDSQQACVHRGEGVRELKMACRIPHPALRATFSRGEKDRRAGCPSPLGRGCPEGAGEGSGRPSLIPRVISLSGVNIVALSRTTPQATRSTHISQNQPVSPAGRRSALDQRSQITHGGNE